VIGSWTLCCATCEDMGFKAQCTATGMTYPPWDATYDTPRECSFPNGGNVFWDGSYCLGEKYPLFPTQWQGWVVQIVCTWGGYLCMFVGVFQATQLHRKLAKKWRAIRRGFQQWVSSTSAGPLWVSSTSAGSSAYGVFHQWVSSTSAGSPQWVSSTSAG